MKGSRFLLAGDSSRGGAEGLPSPEGGQRCDSGVLLGSSAQIPTGEQPITAQIPTNVQPITAQILTFTQPILAEIPTDAPPITVQITHGAQPITAQIMFAE